MNYEIIRNKNTGSNEVIYCLGFFDGLHLGHQALIEKTLDLAHKSGKKAGLVTFMDLPLTKEEKRNCKRVLMDNEAKQEYILSCGLDEIVFIKFDEICKKSSKEDFIKFLKKELNCVGVVVGEDYRFGYKGEGNANYLLSIQSDDFIVSVVPPICVDNEVVSTTKIINYLVEGKIEKANEFLGRPYSFIGVVEEGFHVGKTMEFPTANIELDEHLVIPLYGVYAVKIKVEGNKNEYKGMANIGIRPSINTLNSPLLEVNIFDFNDKIYKKKIKIELLCFIRKEMKFNTIEDLKEQIKKDEKKTLEILG